MFQDRRDAGRQLAAALDHLRAEEPVILGLPRGGVVVADEVARALDAPLDVLIVRKLGAPFQPELAIGSIAEGGIELVNRDAIAAYGIDTGELDEVIQREQAELERRITLFRKGRSGPKLKDRTVVLVDDGIATGSTVTAAVDALRRLGAGRIVVAVPVASVEAAKALEARVDELVCLSTPEAFMAVGQWYANFNQVEDAEVVELLGGPSQN